MVHFKGILSVICIFAFAIIVNGCGASSEVNTTEDYKNGKVEPGWLTGMSPEEMKKFYDGITDSETKKKYADLYFKYMEANLNASQKNANINLEPQKNANINLELGKVIINNATNHAVKIGVEGPINKSWDFTEKGIQRDNLPPGEYFQWWERGEKREYKMIKSYCHDRNGKKIKVERYDMLTISATTSASLNGETANGVLNYSNR